jgi:hypothetical protein
MRKSKENHDGSKERHFPGRMFPKIGNPFPTAWDISLSIVVADIGFAWPRPPPAEVSELALKPYERNPL